MHNIVIITPEAAIQACPKDIVEHGSKNLMKYISNNGCIIFNDSYKTKVIEINSKEIIYTYERN
jgi:hypothetical protein